MNQLPARLQLLVGKWKGHGTALFPTTETFAYQEETEFISYPEKQLLHYIQRTWIIDDKLVRIRPSHFEAGFISVNENQNIVLNNAQSGGRVEVLSGKLQGSTLALSSDLVANDLRMVSSSRWWTIEESNLTYEMMMQTKDVERSELHLSATLSKVF